MNGGARIAKVLHDRGVREIFTLCGGHISPVLVEAKKAGIRITDVRDEAAAVFAAAGARRRLGDQTASRRIPPRQTPGIEPIGLATTRKTRRPRGKREKSRKINPMI